MVVVMRTCVTLAERRGWLMCHRQHTSMVRIQVEVAGTGE
jgi:hypothetical protein